MIVSTRRAVIACGLVATSFIFLLDAKAADAADIQLPAISVQGDIVDTNPIHSQAQNVDLGPLGTAKIQDTPYTVNVVPQALIDNQQLKSVQDALQTE